MKKFLFFVSALAGLFLAASCQQENLEPVVEGGVTYTISLPETVHTKGQSGYDEYDLYYEVYRTADVTELQSANLLFEKKVEMQGNQTTLTLDLLNDQSYTILFWANKKGVDYFDLSDLRKVTVKQAASNNNDRDAFCGKDVLVDFDAADSKTVQLTRPFAQLNIATVVPAEAEIGYDITPKNSFVKVSNIPVTYNVSNGTVTGDTEVSFDKNTVPTDKKVIVNTDSYDLVAMNYVLVPAGNVSVYYEIETANGTVKNTINNVPLKVNYRTNIIGNLLTSNADYTVEILPGFEEGAYVGPEFVQQPVYDEETKTWTVTNADEFRWVAAAVNGEIGVDTKSAANTKTFKDETIVLANDIDLKNVPWTPIGATTGFNVDGHDAKYAYNFRGTFDGNGKVISNLKVDNADCAGLFGHMTGATVKNLTIDGFDLNADHYAGAILGWGETGSGSIIIENCKALNGKIRVNVIEKADGTHDLGDKAGAIVGFSYYGIYTGNEAQNVEIVGYRDLGGIVGYGKNTIVKNCKVTEVALRQDLTIDYKKNEEGKATPTTLDNYIGRAEGTCTLEENEGTVTKNTNVLVEETEEKTATEAFAETLANVVEGDVINIAADVEITLPHGLNAANAETITIVGNGESSVLAGTLNQTGNNQLPGNYAEGKHLVFKNITYKTANNGYAGGFGHAASVTFINCKIIGQMYAHNNAPHYFYDCTIDPLNGYLYTYASDCVFEGCTFEASEGKALQVYGEEDVECDVTIKDCDFIASKQATTGDSKPVTGIDINSAHNYRVNVTIENCTTIGFPTGLNSGSDLYNIKDDGIGKVNLIIDGKYIVRRGYTAVAGYPNLYIETATSEYHVFDLDGLKDLHDFFKANQYANSTWGKTYNISADIDADGYTWEGIWMNTGSSTSNGLILNGNNHTIENLTIKDYMFAGNPTGTVEASTPGEVKNITMKNVTVNGSSHDATVFWGNCHGNVNFTNVTVDGTRISGGSNVGALMSRTTLDGIDNIVVNFTNCKVINSTLKADNPNADPTGASGFIGRAYGATKLSFSGCSEENNTIINENGLVGGKVYGYTAYLDGFVGTGACDEFTDWGGLVYAAKVGTEVFGSITEAVENAKAGDTVTLISDLTLTETLTLPAGIIFNGNGKQIEGTISAAGDLTLEGHTKVTSFSAGFSGNTITIEEGACLEMTGTGRGTFGYANTFDIKGNVTDAKTADKSEIQPSLIIPGGISITGGNGFTLNLENAYIKIGNTSSKNSAANGTFTLNITNSIVDFTNQLTFSEPTNGNNPTFNLNIKDSKVTTAAKFCIAAPNTNVVIDNSIVMPGTYLRNSGSLTLKNRSELKAATIQFGESGGNNGTITVDNSKFTITTGNNTGHAYDGRGVGKIIAKNGAEVSVEHYKAMTIEYDATSTFTGTEVQ